jgi:hypothetical protein
MRAVIFLVRISTVLLYGSECWIAGPEIVLKELRAATWTFAMMLSAKKKKKEMKSEDFRLLKEKQVTGRFAETINLAALFIRRKLKWMQLLLLTDIDSPSKDVFENKPEYFDKWFFDITREEARELAGNEEKWEEFVENCIEKHGGIRNEGSEKKAVAKKKKKSRFSQKPPQQSEDDFWKDNLAVNELMQTEDDDQFWERLQQAFPAPEPNTPKNEVSLGLGRWGRPRGREPGW